MNCKTIERWALLEASREAGALRVRIVAHHCARCKACARFRASLPAWAEQARAALDVGDLGRFAAERVVFHAPACSVRRTGPGIPARALRPAFAAAALVALLTAVVLWRSDTGSSRGVAARSDAAEPWISEVDLWDLEAELLTESLAAVAWELPIFFSAETEDASDELDALARELIRLEESA